MTLHELFNECPLENEITLLANDSRDADADTLFIAYTGFDVDVHQYIPNAYAHGCRYFVVHQSRDGDLLIRFPDALFFPVEDLKAETARLALMFYEYPDEALKIIGITGTNGKTTTATLIDGTLRGLGQKTAFFGTVEWRVADEIYPAQNTTPDLLKLVKLLYRAVELGVEYVVMEIASHGLSMGRVQDIAFDAVCFTNLTQDHLDYHGTLEHYFLAKQSLFTEIFVESHKQSKKAFINVDDSYGLRIFNTLEKLGVPAESLSIQEKGMWNAQNIVLSSDKTEFEICKKEHCVSLSGSLLGLFNVQNYLTAFAVLVHFGFHDADVIMAIKNIAVVGRLEKVLAAKGVTFLVDYAHTPDAIEKAIDTVNCILSASKKSLIVFGAGGDRDPTKRPLMAQAAAKADVVIVTSDNPRTEDPLVIIDDVLKGLEQRKDNIYNEPDRARAIALAHKLAEEGDIVLVAGKGHEDYQIIGKQKYPFSDLEEIRKFC